MQGIDSHLADELGDGASVRSDLHPGTGLVKPGGPCEARGRFQTCVVKQDATAISIGAADDFALRAYDGTVHQCRDEAWIAESSGRAREQMQTYLRRQGAPGLADAADPARRTTLRGRRDQHRRSRPD